MQCGGRPPGCDTQYVDVYNEKPVRAVTKVIVPVKQHPKVSHPQALQGLRGLQAVQAYSVYFQFNFVGKLLGPRGSSLKQLQSSSMTKMAILGKGSMRNPAQEEELRASTDPKHSHLGEDLHVEVSTFASPAEAHARLSLALSEIRAYLIPDSNDQIRQQQMRDIKMIKMSGTETPSEVETRGLTGQVRSHHVLQVEGGLSVPVAGGEDSGHDSDVSNSPTPPRPAPPPPARPECHNNKSIFDRIFKNHIEDRKRPNFLQNFHTKGGQQCGEPLCKRFK